ncbi:hypothetical protein JCM24511_04919 [Saitozyma sp. JCM 24511]|nr:hypothetical protein JCM24511_04919 [Saitozyma sp. JCM 24511]
MVSPLSPSERSYILTGLSHPTSPTRLDGRPLLASRPISVSYGDAPQASGSARVILGDTEVLAGVRLEVADVDPSDPDAWRTRVEVDVTPQAFPQMTAQGLSLYSTQLTNILLDHFVPSIPALPIIAPTKYFIPYLHLTLLSSSGNVPTALLLAARSAFSDLRIPRTKIIGFEADDLIGKAEIPEGADEEMEKDLSGIKAAVRAGRGGRGKGKAAVKGGDWELVLGEEDRLEGREKLPVLVTLNLVPSSDAVFLDASAQEESACPDRLHCFFTGEGRLCGLRMEGSAGLEVKRIRGLLEEGKRIAGELVQSLAVEQAA